MKICFLLYFIFVISIYPQDKFVQLDVQYQLLLKILTFDRNFNNRFADKIILGVLYQRNYPESENQKNELIKIMNDLNFSVDGKKVEYILIDVAGKDVRNTVLKSNVKLIFVLSLRGVEINDITDVTRQQGILTYSGIKDYMKKGISVGIIEEHNKPAILLNLQNSRKEGADFTSQLLRVSKVLD